MRWSSCAIARGRSRIVSGRQVYDVAVAPGQVDLFPAEFPMDHGWWDCTPGDLVTIGLHPRVLGALAPRERPVALRPTLSGVDETLARLIHSARSEIESGCPSGKLFADGLSMAIIARLRAMQGDVDGGGCVETLHASLQRRLVDHIDAYLGADLRIASLATLVDLPPSRFVRAFRRSFAMTPHRYVMEKRLERAKTLLATGQSLAEIAYAIGFSSQGHFTQAYRRRFGETPGRSRRRAAPGEPLR